MIVIIKGCGANIASIQFALERMGKTAVFTADKYQIQLATHVILPGVGSAKHAMRQLKGLELIDTIRQLKQPVLGICLGMQILYEYSNEGDIECLGIIPGMVAPLVPKNEITIPHMGWNNINIQSSDSALTKNIQANSYFYFVHSYVAPINQYSVAITDYSSSFTAIVQKNNFYGVQFHPERSGLCGEKILSNFLQLGSI